LRVSLDGGTAIAHDGLRPPGSFGAAFDTLAWAAAKGLAFGATCTLTYDTITTIPAVATRLRDIGASELTLHRVRLVGNAASTGIRAVTWEQTRRLYAQLARNGPGAMDLGQWTWGR